MKSRIVKYNDFVDLLIKKYGNNLLKNKKYKMYEYCEEIDMIYKIFNNDISDIEFFYKIKGLKEFFDSFNDIYVYTQCNFIDYANYNLGFSIIKGKELPQFIENYGGAFFNNYPIIFDLNSNLCYMHRFEAPYEDDICIFRNYTNINL